jgi:arabinose-5-phosphate isomerase
MIRELIAQQCRDLTIYFDKLDCDKAEQLLERLLQCKGMVILSGVGKSGYIAQKIVATFLSTGTKALFLDPMHAVHGDLGVVSPNDLFLALSKSGESEELLTLISYVRARHTYTVALSSNGHSRLVRRCDFFLELPMSNELCPYNLAPTTSTAIQLLFGDCLAMALMQKKQISLQEIALNHPSGFLGRKISLRSKELMLTEDALPLATPSDLLISVLPELSAKQCGCLLLVDQQKRLQGIFTDGDLRRALERGGADVLHAPLATLMTKTPHSLSPDELAWDALRKMEERMITVMPVLESDRVVGLLRMHDILQAGLSLK